MKLSAILAPMIAAGVTGDVILATVKAFEEQDAATTEKSRQKARDRWHKWKDRLDLTAAEWRDLTNFIKERDGYVCVYCGSGAEPLHVDHKTPLIQGGTNDPDNLATACRECNCGKSGRTVEEWRGGE